MGFIWGEYFVDIEIAVNYKMALFENIRKRERKKKPNGYDCCAHTQPLFTCTKLQSVLKFFNFF